MTARRSSARSSSVPGAVTGSDSPVPGLSKVIRRLNAVSLSLNRCDPGHCHNASRWDTNPGTMTRSTAPEPTTW
jgi:hypothetical protein